MRCGRSGIYGSVRIRELLIGIGRGAENDPSDIANSTNLKRNTGDPEVYEGELGRFGENGALGGNGTPLATNPELKTISSHIYGIDQPTIYMPVSPVRSGGT